MSNFLEDLAWAIKVSPNGDTNEEASGMLARHTISEYAVEPARGKLLEALAIVHADCWDGEIIQFRSDLKKLIEGGDREAILRFLNDDPRTILLPRRWA